MYTANIYRNVMFWITCLLLINLQYYSMCSKYPQSASTMEHMLGVVHATVNGCVNAVPAIESWRPPGSGSGAPPEKIFEFFLHKNGVFWCTLEHGFKLNHVPAARSCAC